MPGSFIIQRLRVCPYVVRAEHGAVRYRCGIRMLYEPTGGTLAKYRKRRLGVIFVFFIVGHAVVCTAKAKGLTISLTAGEAGGYALKRVFLLIAIT